MPERQSPWVDVVYPYIALARHTDIDEVVLTWLTERGKLPKDILVRAHIGAAENYEDDSYSDRVNEAVIAALEDGPLPEFVTRELPNAFEFSLAANYDFKNSPHPMSLLDGDFHRFWTIHEKAEELEINPRSMYPLWHRIIAEIEPGLALDIETVKNSTPYKYLTSQAGERLRHTVIKDAPTFELFEDTSSHPRLYRGLGKRCLLPLGYMLADNYPEIIDQLEKMEDRLDK